jgi:5-formyltetrahydrofolate cyclo-ligase
MSHAMQTEWSGHHEAKDRLRTQVWTELQVRGAAVGDPVGHIPRFIGAERAAEHLAALLCWDQARVVKCNPDRAQEPVRLRALQDGKQLYMAVPRLTKPRCFVVLEAALLAQQGVELTVAATNRGAMRYGRLVTFEEMQPIDLVVVGCVAVSLDGGRTGKGAGFADLELGILRQFGLVQADTPVVTTVHAIQIVAERQLPMLAHDWSLTWIVTPEEALATQATRTYMDPPALSRGSREKKTRLGIDAVIYPASL